VIAELALALVLLSGAGLMMRTILRLWAVNPGFNTQGLLVMTVGLSPKTADSPALIRTAWQQIVERVRSTPGVEAAALDSIVPLSGDNQSLAYWTSAEKSPPKDAPFAEMYSPTPDYLRTMKIPLLRGRFFTERDRIGTQPVIVIDETMVKRVFPGKDPVGSELSIQLLGRVRIVGVVGAVKHQSLDESAYQQPMAAIYLPFLQFPDEFMRLTQGGMNLLVRTSISPVSLIQAIKQSVLGPARDQPVRDVLTMEQLIGASIGKRRGMLMLLGIFAGVALVLASIGIYGVISYSLSRRVQEIGIRMALGAQPGQVLRLIVRQAMGMVLIGIAAGTAASLGLTHLIAKLLYGVSPTDPVTFGAVIATLCMVAVAAVGIPARRAARIDPVIALRYE
jgi:putative ABC transport system permease protein